jgi:hypothetical protein
MKVKQQTKFPEEQGSTLEITCDQPVELTLNIRYPYWAEIGIEILVNGKSQKVDAQAGSFVPVTKKWVTGDKVEIKLPFSLRLETMPDDKYRVAIMYGPMVLAGDLGPENDPAATEAMYVPVLMAKDKAPATWLEPVSGEPNTFKTKQVGRPRDIVFKPFFQTHERRYSVYFDVFDEPGWSQYQADYKAKDEARKEIERMTIDFFQPGEMQPERDHRFKEEKTWTNEFKHRKNREADRGGWFSFDMTVYKGQPMALAIEYWGGFPGSRTFDILANGTKIATENISNVKPGEFFIKTYELPGTMTFDKNKVTVKLVPHDGHRAGPIFGVRTLKR